MDRFRNSVFIVDDSADYRFLLSYFLGKFFPDCHFQLFDGAQPLLDAMHGNGEGTPGTAPSLIILDLHMPGIDGYEVLRILKSPSHSGVSHWRNVPVVINSSEVSEEAVRKCHELGMSAFMQKSANIDDLHKLRDFVGIHMQPS